MGNAITVEEIQILVEAETSKAVAALGKVTKKSDNMATSLISAAKVITGSAVLVKITNAFIDISKEAGIMASAHEEAFSKMKTVYGSASSDMTDWANNWADNVGRSSSDAITFAANIGDMLKPVGYTGPELSKMSQAFVELSADMGSFNNIKQADVMRDLQAVITGQFEPLMKYGVILNATTLKAKAFEMGIGDGTRALTAQEKVQVGFAAVLDGTKDAQGDLVRTYESTANTTERLAASNKDLQIAYGTMVNEGLTPFKAGLADLTQGLADYLTKQNEAKAAIKEVGNTGKSTATDLEVLTSAIKMQENEVRVFSADLTSFTDQYGMFNKPDESNPTLKRLRRELAVEEEKLETLQLQENYARQLISLKAQGLALNEDNMALMREQQEEESERLANLSLQEAAQKRVTEILNGRVSEEEKVLSGIQEEINYWSNYTDVIGVQRLIIELAGERTEAQKALNDSLEDTSEELEVAYKYQGEYTAQIQKTYGGLQDLALLRKDEMTETELLISQKREEINAWSEYIGIVPEAEDIVIDKLLELQDIQKNQPTMVKKMGDAWDDWGSKAVDSFASVLDGVAALSDSVNAAALTDIDNEYSSKLAKYEELSDAEIEYNQKAQDEKIAALRATGEDMDALEADALEAQYAREEESEKIQEEYDKKRSAAEYEAALSTWKYSLAQGSASAAQAVLSTMASIAYPWNIPLAAAQGIAGGLQIAAISTSKPKRASYATGGSFITDGAEEILVGDNSGGQERVDITPISSPNISGPDSDNIPIINNMYMDGALLSKWITNGTRYGNIKLYGSSGLII